MGWYIFLGVLFVLAAASPVLIPLAVRISRIGAETASLRTETAILRQKIEQLEAGRTPQAEAEDAPAPPAKADPADAPAVAFPPPPSPPPPAPAPRAAPAPVAAARPAPAGTRSEPASPAPTRTEDGPPQRDPLAELLASPARAVKNWFTAGNAPVKAGVLLSLIGLGFLIQTALNRGWITLTLEMRMAAAALFGAAMTGVGLWVRRRNLLYALSLQGGGSAVLYLTVYASLIRYEVLPGPAAVAAVVVITVWTGALSTVQDSRALSVLGLIGGFLAPVLISVDDGSHLLLFTYMAVLGAAVLALTWFKGWPELSLLAFAFTYGVSAHWLLYRYHTVFMDSAQISMALFAVMYISAPLLLEIRGGERRSTARWTADGPLIFGAPFAVFLLQNELVGHTEYGPAFSALGLAALHGGLLAVHWRVFRERRLLSDAHLGLGLFFASLAVLLAFDSFYISLIWAAEGAGVVWLGLRRRFRLLAAGGAVLQGLAGVSFVWFLAGRLHYPADTLPVVNPYLAGSALLAAAGLFSAWLYDREQYRTASGLTAVWMGMIWGAVWLLWGGAAEIVNQLSYAELGAVLVWTSACLGGAALAAPHLRWPRLAALGTAVLPAMAAALYTAFLWEASGRLDHPFGEYGWAAWPAALAVFYLFLRLREDQFPKLAGALHAGGLWLLAALAALEVSALVDRSADGVWPASAGVTAALAVTSIPLWWNGRRPPWPLRRRRRIYLTAGTGTLLAGLAASAAVLLLTSNGDPHPLIYLPLLNPLEAAALLVAAAAFLWRRRTAPYEDWELSAVRRNWAGWTAAYGMLLLTMTAVRAVHHWFEVPFRFWSMFSSTLLQASLSILWGLAGLGAMAAGGRLGRRPIWIAGASLMGVVVVKLFLVDLGNTGTLARVVSFLGVGVLLLIVGYFSPVPPAAAPDPEPSPPQAEDAA